MKKNLFTEILKESKENQKIIGLRLFDDEDDFWCGYVVDFNDELIKFKHFTKYGKPDGILVEQICNIQNIDFNDDNSKSYQFLIENNNSVDRESKFSEEFKLSIDWKLDLLKFAKSHNSLIQIEFDNELLIHGFIIKFDKDFVEINCIGNLGENEDSSIYRVGDINAIYYDRFEVRKRTLLNNWRYNK